MTTDPQPTPENDPSQNVAPETEAASESAAPARPPRILIGSQRDLGAVRPAKKRDWYVPGEEEPLPGQPAATMPEPPAEPELSPAVALALEAASLDAPPVDPAPIEKAPKGKTHFPPPNIRDRLPPELEEELEASLGDMSLDDLMTGSDAVTSGAQLEPESKHAGRVIALGREEVFVELGSREQGTVPMRQFDAPPEVGDELTVAVVRFHQEDGLYELRRPGVAASVGDWSDIEEGTLVEARITGHNTGGLECEVNRIRGFIPVSQISLYRVDDLAQFVDQKMTCIVTEANPERRNLVLSHRAVLEREREEAKNQLLGSLAPGQVHEGVVRKLMDFGAFVDLGGVDGLLHVSELGWGRVHHPNQVLQEGQRIKVKVLKVDPDSHRISLGYRDMLENPWEEVERKFPTNTVVQGKVVKIMEFGAFVELEPGIEGLVHISELDHKRVWRATDVVSEGQEVEVLVKSIDKQNHRISLSIKDAHPVAQPEKKDEQAEPATIAAASKAAQRRSNRPLKGGLGRVKGADHFGLNW